MDDQIDGSAVEDGPPRRQLIQEFIARYHLEGADEDALSQALTHKSYAAENPDATDNERLEFLGDAVLGCLAARFVYERYPENREGLLSKKKAFLVSRREFGLRAKELGLDKMLLLGRGEEMGGGRRRGSNTGSALEAVAGALFMALPLEQITGFVMHHIFAPAVEALENNAHLDHKSRLQELTQKMGAGVPIYRKTGEEGPAHEKHFTVQVFVDGIFRGEGQGRKIKAAEDGAAKQALESLLGDSIPGLED